MTSGILAALFLLQAPPAGGAPSLTPLLFQFGLIFLIFYFLIIRPQQKQKKRHEQALRTLKRGDRVVTSGGIIGEVVHIREGMKDGATQPTMDDEVTMKSAESRFIVERGRIAKIVTPTTPAST
ncbi:MAG TPA: preprotein translocase subunit YajC [Gemmatimonadaceae bacterium]|nr:preprotein translocase subunit YajC [Gemmatimonadaceae bacterium]